MRKVKVTLRPGSGGKKLYLFPTPEALYVWMCSMEHGEHVHVQGLQELLLEPGGFIEAELRGFEYAFEDSNRHRRLDLVRLGLAQKAKNASGFTVTTHAGWVSGGLLPMRPYVDADIEVSHVTDDSQSLMDLESMFNVAAR